MVQVTLFTAQDIKKTFPYGATVVTDTHSYPIVDLEYKENNGQAYILGWGFPNKDFIYVPSRLEKRDDGWVILSEGTRYLLKPLDEKSGKQLKNMISEF